MPEGSRTRPSRLVHYALELARGLGPGAEVVEIVRAKQAGHRGRMVTHAGSRWRVHCEPGRLVRMVEQVKAGFRIFYVAGGCRAVILPWRDYQELVGLAGGAGEVAEGADVGSVRG